MIMEGKCSITSRSRLHDQQIRAEGRTATAKVKDFEPDISSGRSEWKQGASESTSCQSLGTRPLLAPRPIKHVEFSKSPVTVCSSSANHASLPCSTMQSHSPSTKIRLSSIPTPALSTNSLSQMTKSSNERLQKPQTPPKPHFLTPELKEKRINKPRGKFFLVVNLLDSSQACQSFSEYSSNL